MDKNESSLTSANSYTASVPRRRVEASESHRVAASLCTFQTLSAEQPSLRGPRWSGSGSPQERVAGEQAMPARPRTLPAHSPHRLQQAALGSPQSPGFTAYWDAPEGYQLPLRLAPFDSRPLTAPECHVARPCPSQTLPWGPHPRTSEGAWFGNTVSAGGIG